MTKERRRRHAPEQIVTKLRDADAMLNAGKQLAIVLQTPEIAEAMYHRWRQQYGGTKRRSAWNRLTMRIARAEIFADLQAAGLVMHRRLGARIRTVVPGSMPVWF